MRLFGKSEKTGRETAYPVDTSDADLLVQTDWSKIKDELPPDGQPVSQDPHWIPEGAS